MDRVAVVYQCFSKLYASRRSQIALCFKLDDPGIRVCGSDSSRLDRLMSGIVGVLGP